MSEYVVWQRLARPEFGLLNSISECIAGEEWLKRDRFTSVRRGQTILLTSDYGGAHKESLYETISFLVIDLQYAWLWDELRVALRKKFLRDNRRMGYKSLNDQRRRDALVPFLRAANTLPGLLVTFVLDNQATFLLSDDPPDKSDSAVGMLSGWSKSSFRKLTRVGHLAALLVAGMSAPKQNVIWISDDDELAPNVEKIREATRVFGHLLNHTLNHDLSHIRFGTTSFTDGGQRQVEDAVALPDLAAGAIAEIFSGVHRNVGSLANTGKLLLPPFQQASVKSRTIAHWLADSNHPLKKLIVLVTSDAQGSSVRVMELFPEGPGPEYDWSPDVEAILAGRIII
jgi:hypothetical protein